MARPMEYKTARAIAREVDRGRAKFPGNRHLLTALIEEVGELAKAYLQRQGRERVICEATQVAALAVRIIEEGDAIFSDLTDEESQP